MKKAAKKPVSPPKYRLFFPLVAGCALIGIYLAIFLVVFWDTPAPANTIVRSSPTPVSTPTPSFSPSPISEVSHTPLTEKEAERLVAEKNYLKAAESYLILTTYAAAFEDKGRLLSVRGDVLYRAGLFDKAVGSYQSAILMYPQTVSAYLGGAAVLKEQNKIPTAKRLLEDGLKANPGNQQLQKALEAL